MTAEILSFETGRPAELADGEPSLVVDVEGFMRMRETTGRWSPIGGQSSAPLPFGAELSIQLQNTGTEDLDVTILAIDDSFGIVPVYPVDRQSNLLRKGSARIEVSGWARPSGESELVFIVEKARTGRPHDLGYLAQPGIARNADGLPVAETRSVPHSHLRRCCRR